MFPKSFVVPFFSLNLDDDDSASHQRWTRTLSLFNEKMNRLSASLNLFRVLEGEICS